MRLLCFMRLLGFARLLSAYTLTHRILGGVVDFTDELLQHVLEEDHAEGYALFIHNLRDMGSAALHGGERIVNIGGRCERVQGT